MKKTLLLLTAFVLIFTSCSSDDDGTPQDPFIGSWRYFTSFEDGVEVPLDDCESQDTFVVLSNGNYTITLHDIIDNECDVDIVTTGTWVNLGEGLYSTTSEGDTFVQEISFEGNRMYLDDVDGGITYRDVFVRQ